MKKLFILLIVSLISVITFSQDIKYSKVRIFIDSNLDLQKLFQSGIDVEDQLNVKQLDRPEIFVSSEEIKILKDLGLKYEILIDDWNEYYNSLPKLTQADVQHLREKYGITGGFGYGSMGGFYTYNEIVSKLDTMFQLYPHLITQKVSIGTTNEGRNIWMVKITKNPEQLNNRPQVLYTALTHSREPQGMMAVIYYMFYLLEKYGIDPEVTYLVNNREMYFIPCISADGYEYNRQTNPNGGGMWRKNRRNNGDGSYGVDLNRNFGPYEYWNAPNGGSSTSPSSDTYRGTAPFSEPETNSYKNFVQTKNIKACLNYHTYSNLLIYPYGALSRETPDSLIYREFARDMTAWNGYTYGTDLQTVGYSTRGNSDDFLYDGDPVSVRPKCFAMTPEVGSTGFWPTSAEIFPLAIENLRPNLYYSWIVGGYPMITEKKFIKNGDYILPGDQVKLNLKIKNKGLGDCSDIVINVESLSNFIIIDSNSTYTIESILPRSEVTLSQYTVFRVSPLTPIGSKQKLVITTTFGGVVISKDTNSLVIGAPTQVFADNFESGTTQWNLGSPAWGLTTTNPYSPNNSITDSPTGSYPANVNTSLTKVGPFDLSQSSQAYLEFWTRWDIETKWDFGQVQISSNNGTTWISLKGLYTKNGSGSGKQPLNVPGYDGTQTTWVKETMDLSQFLGKSNLLLRFNLQADASVQKDGWYIDDVKILSFQQQQTQIASFSTQTGWNIVSVPLQVQDPRKTALFPTAISSAFAYEDGYVTKDTLLMGTGYWLKFGANEDHSLNGVPLYPLVVSVKPGWNIIGTINGVVNVNSITTNPPSILQSSFYEFSNGYQPVQLLATGRGYWVKSAQQGTMVLNLSFDKISPENYNTLKSGIKVISADNQTIDLYFSNSVKEELPPIPPAGIFDVRFSTNTNIADLDRNEYSELVFSSAKYPIRLIANNTDFRVTDVLNGKIIDKYLKAGEELTISNPQIQRLRVYKTNQIPLEFSLSQNYPNPFNPRTIINYELPNSNHVQLTIMDVLGRVIETIVNEPQSAGRYSVEWDGSKYSSGIYYYELNAGDFRAIKKMMLVK